MTLSLSTSCPQCTEVLRAPVVALDLAEGQYLTYDDGPLVEHVERCEVTT